MEEKDNIEKQIEQALGRKDIADFEQQLKKLKNSTDQESASNGNSMFKLFALAAGIALVFGLSWWMMIGSEPDIQQLAKVYIEDSRSTERSRGDSETGMAEDLNDKALELLKQEKTEQALELLNSQSFKEPCAEARRLWMMALSYLQHGEKESALINLHMVRESGCMLKKSAEELLDEL